MEAILSDQRAVLYLELYFILYLPGIIPRLFLYDLISA